MFIRKKTFFLSVLFSWLSVSGSGDCFRIAACVLPGAGFCGWFRDMACDNSQNAINRSGCSHSYPRTAKWPRGLMYIGVMTVRKTERIRIFAP